jgi:hypothetical protein
MVALARESHEPPVDLLEPGAGPLAWAAREASKPGRIVPEGEDLWALHASQEWSRAHLEDSREDVSAVLVAALLAELAKLGRLASEVRHAKAHRWRFARAQTPAHQGCLHDPETALAVCGDWLESARVEGAFTSGLAAAERLL